MREHPGPVCPHCGLDFLRPGCSSTVKALGACPRCEKAVVSDHITENDAGPRAPEYGPLISLDDIGQRTREHLRRGRWWRWPALAAFIALYMGALYLGVSYHVIPHTWTGIIAFAAIGGASPFISLGDRIRARDGLCCPRCKRAWDTEVLRTSNCARCGLQIIDRKSYFKER
ncbi:MAG TPA: hypothetical protein VK956_02730 [Verrucomicrobium sp.]|nr:hypothetical protein [Verrucomicrobium sp.]